MQRHDPTLGRFMGMDTWPLDYDYPVELNRYVYTAGNPATYIDPSGYAALASYTKIHDHISKTYQATVGGFTTAVVRGIIAGVIGHVAGTLAYAVYEEFTTMEYVRGETAKLDDILQTFVKSWRPEQAALSAVFGGFYGGSNYLIGTALKADYWKNNSGMVNPAAIDRMKRNMSMTFFASAIKISGLQNIVNLLSNSGNSGSGAQPTVLFDVFFDVFFKSLTNVTSTYGATGEMPRDIAIVLVTGFNSFRTLSGSILN